MADFCQSDPDFMKTPLLAERSYYFKRDPKGVSEMCELIEEVRTTALEQGLVQGLVQGREQGIEQGREQGLLKSITNIMEHLGLTAQQALDAVGVPQEERARYLAML